ncbi:MAG TPA: glycosyltransferase family 4 protein [Anaerolineales bacterium]|nr:glycosyltransferase family 4 protein [Anaerolineales bacterium]
MRILFLTQIVPYPPDAGPKVKTWHVIRALADFGHKITLVTYTRAEEEEHLPVLREICEEVYPVRLARSRPADLLFWLKSQLSGRPFLIERDDRREMRDIITKLLEEKQFDAIHADQLTMTQFAISPERSNGGDTPQNGVWPETVFDAHNAVWTIVSRLSENANPIMKPVLSLERNRIRRFEGRVVCDFDHTLAVIEPDRTALLEAAAGWQPLEPPSIEVIPIAVDTDELAPVIRRSGSLNILTLGTLHYPPNADGIRWFLNSVFPLIRERISDATLTIVGRNPPGDFLQAAATQPGVVEVTGFVPELTPLFERAGVVVIPVRAGGGMRVRILEAFSRAMPVVTTSIGIEGIEAEDNREVVIADTAEDFSDAVCRLLTDFEAQEELGRNGRELAVSRYDWKVVLEGLKSIYPP